MSTNLSFSWTRLPIKLAAKGARFVWELLPERIVSLPSFRKLGGYIHRAHIKWEKRYQSHFTRFARNPPLFELLKDLVSKIPYGRTLRVASFGCSTGAELYTLLWYLRTGRPDLHIFALGTDIVQAVIEKADRGEYAPHDDELAWLTPAMKAALLDSVGDVVRVKDSLRDDTRWMVADATDRQLKHSVMPVDLLLANNFLGPMPDALAEACMENLLGLVVPGGYIVLDGVDLDLKTRFAKAHRLVPICDKMEAINRADFSKAGWPWKRWASEPIEKSLPDWQIRYSVVFVTPLAAPMVMVEAEQTSTV